MHFGAPVAAFGSQWGGQGRVGVEGGDFGQRGQTRGGGASEFRLIGHEEGLASLRDDSFGDTHFGQVKIQNIAISINRRTADHGVINFELAEELGGKLPNQPAI